MNKGIVILLINSTNKNIIILLWKVERKDRNKETNLPFKKKYNIFHKKKYKQIKIIKSQITNKVIARLKMRII